MDNSFIWYLKGEIIEKILENQNAYVAALVPEWSNQIIRTTLEYLSEESKKIETPGGPQFKWLVQVSLIEKTPKGSNGIYTQAGALFDAAHDSMMECRWENKAIICTCFVFKIHLP